MNNKAHLRPQDYDSNGDIIPDAVKEYKGDLISREALKDAIAEWKYHGFYDKLIEVIDNAPTAPQINILCENADEKAIADMKEELQKVIDDIRPQGKWIDICTLPIIRECSICGNKIGNEMGIYNNFCPNCGADMRGDTNGINR